MEAEMFNKHYATGFDLGWHRDVPRFTPDDWHAFFILAGKLWTLELTRIDLMRPSYIERYQALPFLQEQFGAPDPREQMRVALGNMMSPLGGIDFDDVYGLQKSFIAFFDKTSESVRQSFLDGIGLADEGPGGRASGLLEILRGRAGAIVTSAPALHPK